AWGAKILADPPDPLSQRSLVEYPLPTGSLPIGSRSARRRVQPRAALVSEAASRQTVLSNQRAGVLDLSFRCCTDSRGAETGAKTVKFILFLGSGFSPHLGGRLATETL